jgi:uncharacterized membrane protein YphA (DoxX/SURF4 family)
MEKILKQGRLIFAIAIFALGVEHLVYARLPKPIASGGGSVIPVIPWVPGYQVFAYLTGVGLIAASICIAVNMRARPASILLGIFFLLCVIVLDISRVAAAPLDIGVRTLFFETLSLSASALTLAGTLPQEGSPQPWDRAVNALIKLGRFLFAASAIVFGIDHFLILKFIASLVPGWIPGAMFWACFTGAGFIAAGICIATKWMDRWGAAILGLMFLLWFLVLHAPRVLSAARFHNPDEWSSALIALAMCGGCWIHGLRQLPQRAALQTQRAPGTASSRASSEYSPE